MIGAKLFSRPDGTSPLIGFNWSNSVNNETMEITAQIRRDLGFEEVVRFEHHITIEEAGEMPFMLRNYLDKHGSVNRIARAAHRREQAVLGCASGRRSGFQVGLNAKPGT